MLFEELQRGLQELHYTFTDGIPSALHGGAANLRMLIPLTAEAFEKTERALVKLRFRSDLPLPARLIFFFREDYGEYRGIYEWTFRRGSHLVSISLRAGLPEDRTYGFYQPLPQTTEDANLPLDRTITMRMPQWLLGALKERARREGVPYQGVVRRLLRKGLTSNPCCCRN